MHFEILSDQIEGRDLLPLRWNLSTVVCLVKNHVEVVDHQSLRIRLTMHHLYDHQIRPRVKPWNPSQAFNGSPRNV